MAGRRPNAGRGANRASGTATHATGGATIGLGNTLDPDAVSLKAIQALDRRTQATRHDVERLREENASLRRTLQVLRWEIEALKTSAASKPR